MYPPSLWSIHENVKLGLPRTTNQVEAWHSRWNKFVGVKHVGVFKIIEVIRLEQNSAATRIELCMAGGSINRKQNQCQRDARLQKVVVNYNNYELSAFNKAIAMNLFKDQFYD